MNKKTFKYLRRQQKFIRASLQAFIRGFVAYKITCQNENYKN